MTRSTGVLVSVRAFCIASIVVAADSAVADGLAPTVEAHIGGVRVFAPGDGLDHGSFWAGEVGLSTGLRVRPNLVLQLRGLGLWTHIPAEHMSDVGRVAYDVTRFYIGAGAHYSVAERVWVGGGAGFVSVRLTDELGGGGPVPKKFAVDLRAGYTLARAAEHALDASIELTSAVDTEHEISDTDLSTQLSLLVGYRFN